MKKNYFPILIVLFLSVACTHKIRLHKECKDSDKECLKKAARAHPVQSPLFWTPFMNEKADKRVFHAPPEILDYVLLQNRMQDFPDVPNSINIDPSFEKDFHRALAELPASVKKAMDNKLLAIFLAQDIGGSGFTEMLRDPGKQPWKAFIVFDQKQLQRQANAWATWKESSVFKTDPAWELQLQIAANTPKENTRKNAISFILLHELGHVLAIGENFHPSWDGQGDARGSTFPFTELSWPDFKSWDVDMFSKFDKDVFPLRPKVKFYSNGSLEAAQMPETYRQLAQTDFVSLYASINPGDDFAEAFATYVHSILLKRPYQLKILKDGKIIHQSGLCWAEERCQAKRKIIEDFLAR